MLYIKAGLYSIYVGGGVNHRTKILKMIEASHIEITNLILQHTDLIKVTVHSMKS